MTSKRERAETGASSRSLYCLKICPTPMDNLRRSLDLRCSISTVHNFSNLTDLELSQNLEILFNTLGLFSQRCHSLIFARFFLADATLANVDTCICTWKKMRSLVYSDFFCLLKEDYFIAYYKLRKMGDFQLFPFFLKFSIHYFRQFASFYHSLLSCSPHIHVHRSYTMFFWPFQNTELLSFDFSTGLYYIL